MPDRSWLCGRCEEQNPPFTEVCRNCYTPFSLDAEISASRLATIRHFNPSGTLKISDSTLRGYAIFIGRVQTAVSYFFLLAVPLAVAVLLALFPPMHAQISRVTSSLFRLSYLVSLGAGVLGLGFGAALDLSTRKYQVGNERSGMKALVRLYFTQETSAFRKVQIVLALFGFLLFTAMFSLMVGLLLAEKFIL